MYAYVGGNPISYVDPFGLEAGDCYPTANKAASNAISDINPTSIAQDREYAGWVYKTDNGYYSYTEPRPGSAHSSSPGPRVSGAIGDYHTHGAGSPGYDGENFSPADMRTTSYPDSSYLGTPSGAVKKYSTSGKPFRDISKASPNNQDACGCSGSNSWLNSLW